MRLGNQNFGTYGYHRIRTLNCRNWDKHFLSCYLLIDKRRERGGVAELHD
jgi:hypothetical protein